MTKLNKEAWTDAEDQLLIEYYHTMGFDTLTAVLPGRDRRDMAAQVVYLKRKNKTFNY
jgi:hypothetical protein